MKRLFTAALPMLLCLLLLAACGAPESSGPDSLEEYLSVERYLPERLYTARPREAPFRYETFSDGVYRIPQGEKSGTLWLPGEWSVAAFDEDVVYLMSAGYELYRIPAGAPEPERMADLSGYLRGWEDRPVGEQGKYRYFMLFGETLFVFRGADSVLYGLYLPAGEVYPIGDCPDTEAVYILTNRSFLYQLPTGKIAEDGFSDLYETFLCTGGRYYRVLSGTEELLTGPEVPAEKAAVFLPVSEDGTVRPGGNFEEVSLEEAGL